MQNPERIRKWPAAKVFKKTPTKSIRTRKNHLRPRKNTVVRASLKAFYTCRARLFKFSSILAGISGIQKKTRRKRDYGIVEKVPEIPGTDLHLLPDRKTVVLDLDGTLVYSRIIPSPEKFDFIFTTTAVNGMLVTAFVSKRPLVDEFLESLSKKYEIVVFTAGARDYASPILDFLDENGVISHRLYRDSCRIVNGKLVKDLSRLGRDMKKVVIVDDNPNVYALQPENAIPIRPFRNDVDDRELKKLIEFFDACDGVEDMRVAVKDFLAKQELEVGLCLFPSLSFILDLLLWFLLVYFHPWSIPSLHIQKINYK